MVSVSENQGTWSCSHSRRPGISSERTIHRQPSTRCRPGAPAHSRTCHSADSRARCRRSLPGIILARLLSGRLRERSGSPAPNLERMERGCFQHGAQTISQTCLDPFSVGGEIGAGSPAPIIVPLWVSQINGTWVLECHCVFFLISSLDDPLRTRFF